MSRRTRRNHTPEFKASIALASLCKDQSIAALAREHELHPNQIIQWRHQLTERARQAFEAAPAVSSTVTLELEQRIQQLTQDNDFLAHAFRKAAELNAET